MKNLSLSDLVDPTTIQKLAEAHYRAGGIPIGIIDAANGSILVAAGWQDICTLFHRANPDSLERRRESDNYIKGHLADGEPCQYKCKNGLRDIGIPIVVAGRHLATVFLGQFFYEGEKPEREFFISQARKFSYDPEKYLSALDRVPVFSREKVDFVLTYNKALAAFIADLAERALRQIQAEESLRESEERFRVLSDTSPAAIFMYQGEKIICANAATEKLTGYAEKELMKMKFWDWVHDDFKETIRSRGLARQRGEQVPSQYEFKYVTRSGEERWAFISAGRTEYKRKPAVVVMIFDITERKHAEEALELSQICIDKASIGIYQISEEGNIRSVNEHACQSLGYSMEELCSMSVFDIDPTFTREVFAEHRRQLSASGSRTFETMHRRKDGTTFPVEITVNYLEFRGRKFTVSFAKDISEDKRAEEELRLTQFCVDKASLGIYRISKEGSIRGVNDYACESLGYSKEELCAMSAFDINPTYTTEKFIEHGKKLRADGSVTIEAIHRRKNGTMFPVEITANYVEFHGKKFTISFVKDITERKRAEEQMRASLREKEVLLKEIHHRVKNNLQIISALLELQSDYITDGKSRSIIRESQDRIKSMALVHQKLYQSEDFAVIDFAEYIESLTEYLFRSYVREPDRITLSVDVADVSLGIDEAIPCGLLINELVSNSLKHAFPEDRKGEVAVGLHADDDVRITLTVADNGVGLPSGLDFRDTESLGLQLVNMLARQLGGDIDFQNDGGVTFTIRFSGRGNG